jgi:hypothetical protein
MKIIKLIFGAILILSILGYLGNPITHKETYAQEKPEIIRLAEKQLMERPQEVKAAWFSYVFIRELQIVGYYSNHKITEDFKITFECEREARAFLTESWSRDKAENPGVTDKYLDELLTVVNSGYLSEYVYYYCRWDLASDVPDDLNMDEFCEWCTKNLKDHEVETLAIALPKNENTTIE